MNSISLTIELFTFPYILLLGSLFHSHSHAFQLYSAVYFIRIPMHSIYSAVYSIRIHCTPFTMQFILFAFPCIPFTYNSFSLVTTVLHRIYSSHTITKSLYRSSYVNMNSLYYSPTYCIDMLLKV
jgi:hypothetical protein